MNLNINKWQEFELGKLFDIKKGKRLTAADQEEGSNNYIGAIDSNNGVANHIGQEPIHSGNTISLSYNGSVGEAFYQSEPYWATDDVNALYPYYEKFNEYIGLFFVAVIRKEKFKFSYGRKWTLENMKKTIIKLPILHNEDGSPYTDLAYKYSKDGYVPDWNFMENYIKSLHYKPLSTKNKSSQTLDLHIDKWQEFKINKIFIVSTTKMSIKDDLIDGKVPFISRTAENNGCDGYVEVDDDKISKGNCLTIGAEGIYCFYQPKDFATGNKVYTLRNKNLNSYSYLFVATILNKDDYKYSYGRARIKSKLEEEVIKLPIKYNPNGTPFIDDSQTYSDKGYVPDWKFMEDYIKALPYGDRL